MEPICTFSFFAENLDRTPSEMDIDRLKIRVPVEPKEPHENIGIAKLQLWTHVIADPGDHVLMVTHDNLDWTHTSKIKIHPAMEYSYVHGLTREFPLLCGSEPEVNVFHLILDAIPIGKAYVIAQPPD